MPIKLQKENLSNARSARELTPRQRRLIEIQSQLFVPDEDPTIEDLGPDIADMLVDDVRNMSCYTVSDSDRPDDPSNIVGMVALEAHQPGTVHIDTLVIHAPERGKKYGAQVLTLIEALARANKAERVTLHPVSEDAERFYEANGYQPDGDTGDGMLSKHV